MTDGQFKATEAKIYMSVASLIFIEIYVKNDFPVDFPSKFSKFCED